MERAVEFFTQSPLTPSGPAAAHIHFLWWTFFAALISVFLLVLAGLGLAVLRRRRDAGQAPDLTPEHVTERKLVKVVGSAVTATAVILFAFLLMSFFTGRAISAMNSAGAMEIKITGAQWWWKVQYNDPAASQIVTTANEIYIPVGKPIALKLVSNDVIHSFWVPSLQGKRDLIPGKENGLVLQADQPGTYRGQCAEFCGYQHAKMAFFVIALPEGEFNRWLEQQRRPATNPQDDPAQKGQRVFLTSTCVMCHEIRGTDAAGKVAPELTHIAGRMRIASGTLPNTPENLRIWISDPASVMPGVKMPATPLSPEDLDALVAYLGTLK